MKKKNMLAILPLALLVISASAQTKRTTVKRQTKAKAVEAKVDKQAEEKIEQMTEATQKIMFVDSIVVDKEAFIDTYLLNPEAGRISRYDDFFGTQGHKDSYVLVNEMGNKCYLSSQDSSGKMALYTSDLIDGEWSEPAALDGIDGASGFESPNFPFMMADGSTFYFAAKGKESIGGYDIFVTRYDAESGKFLKPENIGMPFNSTGNDYMYAIDDYGNIGWFATDRGQKDGRVCIYAFVPSTTRETYQDGDYDEEQVKGFARISSIANTWGIGSEREEALERIKQIPQRLQQKAAGPSLSFVINDATVYGQLSDFKVEGNKAKFKKLQELKRRLALQEKVLSNARDYYATASQQKRDSLADKILKDEKQCEELEASVMQLEKEIRNSENKAR